MLKSLGVHLKKYFCICLMPVTMLFLSVVYVSVCIIITAVGLKFYCFNK